MNAVTTVITGALGGQTDVQVVANTLAPYAANMTGSQFEHGEDKNKAAQLASHAILGATLAYLNGGNPAAGGSAAVASEAAADYFANQYNDGKTAINPETGKFDANLLPENVKSGIRDLTAAIGAVVGGTVGDSASNAQLAGVIGQNAVENNEFSIITKGVEKKLAENKKEKEAQAHLSCPKGQSCIIPIPEKSLGDKALNVINDMTLRQLAAVAGAKYDLLTGEEITPNERQLAKASMLGLGFTKSVSGVTRLTDEALIGIEKQYGKSIAKGQVNQPRNVQEQIVWNDVVENPKSGVELRSLNKDQRFPQDAGFVKMSRTVKTKEGKTVEVHYQYNDVTKKVYDMKIVTKTFHEQ
ncbi:VENN motif pre-toxin domain-containing protein [Acinetobacter pittii]|nr:VENN motif pre-toxin domain-containing protein [Acinetobacter pittii]WPP56707.1 VENN motif pre-toxin domain-containing protein [Acinetobacter pittii]